MQNTGPPIGGSSISSVLDGEGSEMTQTSSPTATVMFLS